MKSSPTPPNPGRSSTAKKAAGKSAELSSARFSAHGAWLCHAGKVRRVNEDACLAGTVLSTMSSDEPAPISIAGSPWIVAVSDGIGGHVAGAEASHEVVATLADCKRITPVGVADLLQRLNRRLCDRGRKEPAFAAMGATVAGVGCGRRGLFAFNVGDSRVYRQEGTLLVAVTRDDSEAEELIQQGLLKAEDGLRPGFLHALTQAIGGRHEVVEIEAHIYPLRLSGPTRFLICSDGLTDMLVASEMERVMAENADAGVAVRALFDLAMLAGGADNITIAVVQVERL